MSKSSYLLHLFYFTKSKKHIAIHKYTCINENRNYTSGLCWDLMIEFYVLSTHLMRGNRKSTKNWSSTAQHSPILILILRESDTVCVAADTRCTDKQSLVFSDSIWHRTDSFFHLLFSSFCHSSLYFVLLVSTQASSHIFLCTLQVCLWLRQTKITIVNGLLHRWIAALICSVQATGWQQHMCWWQAHTGQTLAPYNTS